MSGDKTLIAYVTKGGVTGEYASVIASVLREKYGHEVDLVNLKENPSPNLEAYRNVIIGSGVRAQRVYGEALKFLEKDFGSRRVAMFLSSNEAGNPKSYNDAIRKYVTNVLSKYPNVKPVAYEAFGGRIRFLGITFSDDRDVEKAGAWAEELGKKLKD